MSRASVLGARPVTLYQRKDADGKSVQTPGSISGAGLPAKALPLSISVANPKPATALRPIFICRYLSDLAFVVAACTHRKFSDINLELTQVDREEIAKL